MGGLIATRLLLNHQEKFQAAMLSGAAIQSPQEPPAWLISKDKLSAQFLVSMTNAMQECKDNAQRISLPLRIMHGSADVMTAPEGSEFLHNSVSSKDKELCIYDGLFGTHSRILYSHIH